MDTADKRQKVSREGVILLKSFEGLRARAEPLEDGRWVIGYGHTLSAREGQTVGEADAELLLQYDLIPVVRAVQQHVSSPLNQHQFDALVSFAFSVGIDRFVASDVLAKINADSPQEAADAIGAWPESVAPVSTLRRRAAERALFVADPAAAVTVADLLTAPLPLPSASQADTPEPQPPSAPDAGPDARAAAVAALLGEDQPPETVIDEAPVVILFPGASQDEPAAASPSEEAEAVADAVAEAEAEPAEQAPAEPEAAAPEAAAEVEPEAATVDLQTPAALEPDPEVEANPAPAEAAPAPAETADVSNLALSPQLQRYSPYASAIVGPVPGLGLPMQARASLAASAAAPAMAPPAVLHETAHAGAVSQPAPVLVLTPPSSDEEAVIRPVWDETLRDTAAAPDQSPLFDDAGASDAMAPILRHEAEPAPRRFEWSETGAWMIMGGIGLVSFGAAFAAFRRAGTQSIGAGETTMIGWLLAVIAVLCVGLSGYNLYRRMGRRERD